MTTNNYDPDAFDWGDGTQGIDLDEVGPDVVEVAIKAALNAHEETYGWRYLRKSERKEGAGRLFRVNYFMPEEKREFFETEFPGYTFVWDGAMGHHDHPASHLCRELNELEMTEPMVASGKQYIDLFGDGKRNRRYKRNCITLFKKSTPKDYLRYQFTDSSMVEFDMEKLCDKNGALGKIDDITMTHSLYYLSMAQVGRIVNVSPTRRIRALVHRHSETHGLLNAGEQEYWVTENMMVRQENVRTGEPYTHPSLEAMFHQTSARTVHGGVAWTVRAAGGDSFFIDLVGCPNDICEEYVPLKYLKPESWEEYTFSSVTVKKFLHWNWITASTSQGIIRIEDVDLFSKLRRYVAGKQRTPRLKTETVNLARRLCNKADIISIHGGGAHEIPVASMTDYVEVAFYVDQRSELDAAISFHKDNVNITTALNKYYESGAVPKDFSAVTGAAVVSGRMFSDAAVAVINSVRDASYVSIDQYVADNLPMDDRARILCQQADPGEKIPWPWLW